MWINLTNIIKYSGLIFHAIMILSFIVTSLSNPGIANDNMKVDSEDVFHKIKEYKICSICQAIISINKNTHHCFECGVCIDGMNFLIKDLTIIAHGYQSVLVKEITNLFTYLLVVSLHCVVSI